MTNLFSERGTGMNEIITVNTDTQTVSARELHNKLGVEKRFSAWFETNSQGFIEGEDFTSVLSGTVVNNGAFRELQDYALSVDMAKHICLMSRTEKGKEVRQYLIDLEKAWNTPEQVMARALKVADQTIASLKLEVSEMKPKADYFDDLVDRNLLTSFRDTAKEFQIKESVFIKWLIDNNYIYRDSKKKIRSYATSMNKGLFELKEFSSRYSNHADAQTLITPKGRETFRLLLCKGE